MTEPAFSLRTSGRLRRRQVVSRLMGALAFGAALLAVAVLAIVVISVASRGASALSVDFFTKNQAQGFNPSGGGILFAIVGSAVIVGIATVIALPLGVLVAIYISELAPPRLARVARLALDITNGIPTIVIGIFVFTMLVAAHGEEHREDEDSDHDRRDAVGDVERETRNAREPRRRQLTDVDRDQNP